jgi:hypothetical protein
MSNVDVGRTILEQMGGMGRLSAMLGVKNFLLIPGGVSFRWSGKIRKVGNCVEVVLRDDDTYDMTFSWYRGQVLEVAQKFEGVYAEDLISFFEGHTGLLLRL